MCIYVYNGILLIHEKEGHPVISETWMDHKGIFLREIIQTEKDKCSPIFNIGVCAVLSHVRLFVTPWAAAHQDPLSMEFSKQEYLSGLPFPSPDSI